MLVVARIFRGGCAAAQYSVANSVAKIEMKIPEKRIKEIGRLLIWPRVAALH
jgi:hypothetical protein